MPIERGSDGTKVIYPSRTRYLNASRTVVGEIYVDVDGVFHVGTVTAGGVSGPGATSTHGLGDTSIHIGTLGDNQGPQFLKTDGTRVLTGNLGVNAGITVDGIDLSATLLNPGVLDLGGFTLTVPKTGTVPVGTGTATRIAEWVTDANTLQASTLIKSGAGVLTLSAGAAYTFTVPATGTAVLTSRTLTAGAGLTGGGDLGANRAFAVGAGDGIDVAADSIAVDVTDILGSGLTESSNNIDLAWGTPTIDTIQPDDAANAGASTNPARSDHTHGIVAAAASTLTVATTNAEGNATSFARSNHIHTITSSSNPGAAASILASDASGYLRLVRLGIGAAADYPLNVVGAARIDGDLTFVGAQSILTTADSLTLAPAADLDLTPGGTARVRTTTGVRIQSDNYVSQTTGWGISYAGSGDFRYLYADEMHVKTFIADLEQALAGGQIICKSVAPLASAFTAPAAEGNATLVVESFKGFATFKVFVDGDIVRLREFARAGTTLTITNCWGTVVWVSTDTTAKTQTYTFTRSAAPNAGAIATSAVIAAGVLALDYGTTGNGFLESNAIDGAMAEYAPYHQVVSWATHPNSGLTVRTRLGNLKGIFNVANEYGLYAGAGITDADQYLRISNTAVEAHNLPIKMYDGASVTMQLSPTAPSLAMGSTLPSAFGTGTGLWMGKDTLYKWRVGNPAGISMNWDGAALNIYDADATQVFKVDSTGAWLSNLAISSEFGQQFFTKADGLLLLGAYCPLTETSWTSLRNQTATLSGAFHTVNGRFTGTRALMVEKATANEIDNCVFLNNVTDGWTWHAAIGTATHTVGGVYGGYYAALTNTGGGGDVWYSNLTASGDDENWTISFLYRGGDGVRCRVYEYGNGEALTDITFSSDAIGWTKYVASGTTGVAGSTGFRVLFDVGVGEAIDLDGIQGENKAYPTSLCYGGQPWSAWAGAAYNSTSTRAATECNLNAYASLLSDNDTWSVSLWWQPQLDADATMGDFPTLFDVYGADNNNRIIIYQRSVNDTVAVYINGARRLESVAQTFNAGDWQHALVTFDFTTDTYVLYVNGAVADTDGAVLTAPTALAQMNLGTRFDLTTPSNAAFSESALFDSVLTAEEVAAIYQSGKPLTDLGATDTPGIYILDGRFQLSTSAGDAGVTIDADGINIYGQAGALTTRPTKAGTIQCQVNAAGAITAGAGVVTLDADGIAIAGGASGASLVNWKEGASSIGHIYGNEGATNIIDMSANYKAAGTINGQIQIQALGAAGVNHAALFLYAGAAPTSNFYGDVRMNSGLYVGSIGTDPDADDVWCDGEISTDGGTTKWNLGAYTATPPTVDGYLEVVVEGTTYRIAVDAQ